MLFRRFFSFIAVFLIPIILVAQNMEKVDSFTIALSSIKSKISNNTTKATPYISPYYYRLIEPGIYYPSAAKGVLKLDDNFYMNDNRDWINREIDNMLLNIYLTDPSRVKYSGEAVSEELLVDADKTTEYLEGLLK